VFETQGSFSRNDRLFDILFFLTISTILFLKGTSMPDYQTIYNEHANQYELLVSREDFQDNIFRSIDQVTPLTGLDVVEFGAGTGRLTCLLTPVVDSIFAFDHSTHMLAVSVEKLKKSDQKNWYIGVSDHRRMPVPSEFADLAISGWSICYMVVDHPSTWQVELVQALNEMQRLVKPGGFVILLETLGTGCETPIPPADLLEYYAYLEVQGFQRSWIRTDYRFPDRLEAESSVGFFFGNEMLEKIRQDEHGVILPECTGIWVLRKE